MRLWAWGEGALTKNGVSFPKVEIPRGEGGQLLDRVAEGRRKEE